MYEAADAHSGAMDTIIIV